MRSQRCATCTQWALQTKNCFHYRHTSITCGSNYESSTKLTQGQLFLTSTLETLFLFRHHLIVLTPKVSPNQTKSFFSSSVSWAIHCMSLEWSLSSGSFSSVGGFRVFLAFLIINKWVSLERGLLCFSFKVNQVCCQFSIQKMCLMESGVGGRPIHKLPCCTQMVLNQSNRRVISF